MPSWKEHSRTEWLQSQDERAYPGDDKIRLGCLQRIADALESVAKKLGEANALQEEVADVVVPERAARKKAKLEQEEEWRERRRRSIELSRTINHMASTLPGFDDLPAYAKNGFTEAWHYICSEEDREPVEADAELIRADPVKYRVRGPKTTQVLLAWKPEAVPA